MPRRSKSAANNSARLFDETDSGSTGGPPNVAGIAYQLDVALYEACQLIPATLTSPAKDLRIALESREITDEGITRWDLSVYIPARLIEVKRNPTRNDVLVWLDTIRRTDATSTVTLIYSTTSAKIVRSVEALIRIAVEAGGDADRFQTLLRVERIDDAAEVLNRLGQDAPAFLKRMEILNLPEAVVRDSVIFSAKFLAQASPEKFIQELSTLFFTGLRSRRTYSTEELLKHLDSKGVAVEIPQLIVLSALSPALRAAVAVLGYCRTGFPIESLGSVLECGTAAVAGVMEPLVQSGHAIEHEGLWRLLLRAGSIPLVEEKIALEKALSALLPYIDRNSANTQGRALVADAISLTKACVRVNPKAVVRVFASIEKLLKRIGNKHLVLELADLTIAASRYPPVDQAAAEARAKALICGRSWARQRLGDLERARIDADESMQLGEEIGWTQNTAFCYKCSGRLVRMQAERLPLGGSSERERLLEDSLQRLTKAIESFSLLPNFGSTHPEVGDCYSLTGRTYLEWRKYPEAHEALRRAFDLIPDDGRKDHLDMLILAGDLEAAQGRREAADGYYSDVINLPQAADVQISEMFARAYFRRGKSRATLRRTTEATRDFQTASNIWAQIDEPDRAAEAEWEARVLNKQIEVEMKTFFETVPSHLVRIAAHDAHLARNGRVTGAVARRKALPRAQLEQLLKEARRKVAILHSGT